MEYPARPRWFRHYQGRNQIVHQRIMVRPVADSGQPWLEQSEFFVAELVRDIFQEENSNILVFIYGSRE